MRPPFCPPDYAEENTNPPFLPAIAGSGPVEEKMQQRSEQMETAQVMEHADKEMKEMTQIHIEAKGTDQAEQETGQEMRGKHENPHE